MSSSTVKKLPKSTAELSITIPWKEIKDTYDKLFEKISKQTEVPGFRKGKAPKKKVEQAVDKKRVYEEVIKEIIPKIYTEAVKKHKIQPVINPKIELVKAKENEDWELKVTVALKPEITLGEYKEKVRNLKKSKVKIWTPKDKGKKEKDQKPSLDELVNLLYKNVKIEMSDILVDQETNRLLSNLLDQVQKLGMSIDQYLMTKNKNQSQLREEYKKQAEKNLAIEFIIGEIAEKEKITVTPKDIDELLSKVKSSEEKDKLKKDSYYLAHLIRQQKTLDFLMNL